MEEGESKVQVVGIEYLRFYYCSTELTNYWISLKFFFFDEQILKNLFGRFWKYVYVEGPKVLVPEGRICDYGKL